MLLPLLGFVVNGVLAMRVGARAAAAVRAGGDGPEHQDDGHKRWVTLVGPGVVGLSFVLVLLNFAGMFHADLHDPVVVSYWSWMVTGSLEVDAALQLDQLSMIMMLVVTGVGFLIHVFSVGYMHDDPGYARYFSYLNLFVFFMLVLVLGASFPVMFVGWEGVGLCSYLLIGFWFQDREKSDAGKKAFIVNRIGDFGFLVAMFLVFTTFGTLAFAEVFPEAPALLEYGGATVTAITLFLFLGAAGKSAQIPLYVWLPDAMAGPTPVSALIHAATMVTAGVYMVARMAVLFALAPVSSAVVATVGVLTALLAATIALAQHDIKKVLAYSTISQLGYMFLGVGRGCVRRRHLPPDDPRLLQGAPVPRVGRGDSRHAPRPAQHPQPCRPAGHAQHGRAARLDAGHLDHHVDRDPGHRRRVAAGRVLLQGRDHLVRRSGRLREPIPRCSRSSGSWHS